VTATEATWKLSVVLMLGVKAKILFKVCFPSVVLKHNLIPYCSWCTFVPHPSRFSKKPLRRWLYPPLLASCAQDVQGLAFPHAKKYNGKNAVEKIKI
jgi:hypothetical protein